MTDMPLNLVEHAVVPLICTKCEKAADVIDQVRIETKSGPYLYWRFRHLDKRKRSRYVSHYQRIQE